MVLLHPLHQAVNDELLHNRVVGIDCGGVTVVYVLRQLVATTMVAERKQSYTRSENDASEQAGAVIKTSSATAGACSVCVYVSWTKSQDTHTTRSTLQHTSTHTCVAAAAVVEQLHVLLCVHHVVGQAVNTPVYAECVCVCSN